MRAQTKRFHNHRWQDFIGDELCPPRRGRLGLRECGWCRWWRGYARPDEDVWDYVSAGGGAGGELCAPRRDVWDYVSTGGGVGGEELCSRRRGRLGLRERGWWRWWRAMPAQTRTSGT